MKVIKNILNFIFEPFKFLGTRNFSQKIVEFSDNHKWFLYVFTTIIVLLAMFLKYVLPNYL